MKKSNSSSKSLDRLSELPDTLIFHIFWFLPMREVVRTTLLSNRWKNLWKTAPCLNFAFEDCTTAMELYTFPIFVNRALMLWKGMGLQKFKIGFDTPLLYWSSWLFYTEIDLWVCYANENQVQQLHVDLEYPKLQDFRDGGIEEALYWAPKCLYSCSSLQKLFLKGCNLHIPMKNVVNWNRLKDLRIYGYGLSEDLINQVLSGSPQLEVLILSFIENQENLTIQSTSLKHLFIEKYLYYDTDNPSVDTELRISTPNLEKLGILGVPYSKCLMNVPTIQHAEEVVFSDWCIKFALGAMKEDYMVSPLLNASFLEIKVCSQEYKLIVDLLEICPNLRKLVVETTYKSLPDNSETCLEFDRNPPDSFLQRLRTVDVTWTKDDEAIFPLIQILLKYASKLEKMVFREKRVEVNISCESSLIATQKLMRMKRSSPTAELIFC